MPLESLTHSIFLVAIAVALVILLVSFFSYITSGYEKIEYLNSKAEQNFLYQLNRALPSQYTVMCKVRLADIVRTKSRRSRTQFFKISSKHVDFVICEKNTNRILMCVELDDSSHQSKDARRRDAEKNRALSKAKVTLFRVKATRTYSNQLLNKIVAELNNLSGGTILDDGLIGSR